MIEGIKKAKHRVENRLLEKLAQESSKTTFTGCFLSVSSVQLADGVNHLPNVQDPLHPTQMCPMLHRPRFTWPSNLLCPTSKPGRKCAHNLLRALKAEMDHNARGYKQDVSFSSMSRWCLDDEIEAG